MVQLDKPILPDLLYRYRKILNFDREIQSIREQSLWFSTYRKLNDPMEGFYELTPRLQDNPRYSEAVQDILFAKRNLGICCFSDTHDNELMWTHYTGNYSGLCIGYDTKLLISGLPDDLHLVRLAYGGAPPKIRDADVRDIESAAMKVLSHKKASWIYEREWRLIGTASGKQNISTVRCVKSVFLGSRVSPSCRRRVVESLADTEVSIFRMTVADYGHKWDQIKGGGAGDLS